MRFLIAWIICILIFPISSSNAQCTKRSGWSVYSPIQVRTVQGEASRAKAQFIEKGEVHLIRIESNERVFGNQEAFLKLNGRATFQVQHQKISNRTVIIRVSQDLLNEIKRAERLHFKFEREVYRIDPIIKSILSRGCD